jgi:Uncharacterized conserved protein (COG2071)
MKLPRIGGVIRRRILVNYRIAPDLIQPLLPPRFRPKLHGGFAIAGICLIRLEDVRPVGISSENAAHCVAVVWENERGQTQEGVYIPRRDTNSQLNQMLGGRLFPGEHHAAKFQVKDDGQRIDFEMSSEDKEVAIQIRAKEAQVLPSQSGFKDAAEASAFFEAGSLGYSPVKNAGRLEGLRLKTATWKISPLDVEHLHSSFFGDQKRFPAGAISFDCALLMRDIQHEWSSEGDLPV